MSLPYRAICVLFSLQIRVQFSFPFNFLFLRRSPKYSHSLRGQSKSVATSSTHSVDSQRCVYVRGSPHERENQDEKKRERCINRKLKIPKKTEAKMSKHHIDAQILKMLDPRDTTLSRAWSMFPYTSTGKSERQWTLECLWDSSCPAEFSIPTLFWSSDIHLWSY